MATPVFDRWSRRNASDREQETVYEGKKHRQPQDGGALHQHAPKRRYGTRPEGTALSFLDGNREWCDEDQLQTIKLCDTILSNQNWGQQPKNDCRRTLIAIVNNIRREQEWHDGLADRHAQALRQYEKYTGRPVFCAPLTAHHAHWNGRSACDGKRPRASKGTVLERHVVQERVTVSERVVERA